jgi:hypothetical protein
MDTIAITFPEVKVNTEIKDLSFDNIEDMIFEISQNIACRVFEKAITDIDNYLRKNRKRGKLKNTGKRKKYFLTRFGDILYSRTRYKDKKTGKSCYLLDKALSIVKNRRISLSRARIECFLSAFSSYREVVKGIRLLIGGPRCHEAVRQSVIKEGKLLLKNQERKLKQIKNLNYPDKESPDTAYLEADATYISLQQKGKKKKEKMEVKLGVGYTGKEARYKSGKSKRLKEKFTFIGTGKNFMEKLSLIAEERFSLSKVKKVIFGGDGDSWITSGIKDYFSSATYILCLYHLYKKFKSLPKRKKEQKVIKDLLLSNQLDKALSIVDQMSRYPYDFKEKDNLTKLYTYISRNRRGITNQFKLKDKEIERAGAIESNINKVIATRFKKKGMSWSKPGALALLKIKETIINGEWDKWWETERERDIKVDKYKPPLPAACFKKEAESSPLIEVTIPAFSGPDQGKPWVGVLRKLSEVGYY